MGPRRLRVKFDYDLRVSQEGKAEDANDFDGWTCFINKRGSLVHVMRKNCDWLMIRIPKVALKGCTISYMEWYMSRKLYEGLDLPAPPLTPPPVQFLQKDRRPRELSGHKKAGL